MKEIHFWFKKNDRFAFAVTPDRTRSMLPVPDEWLHDYSHPVYPERGAGGALQKFAKGFRQHGYYIYPRNGSMKPEAA